MASDLALADISCNSHSAWSWFWSETLKALNDEGQIASVWLTQWLLKIRGVNRDTATSLRNAAQNPQQLSQQLAESAAVPAELQPALGGDGGTATETPQSQPHQPEQPLAEQPAQQQQRQQPQQQTPVQSTPTSPPAAPLTVVRRTLNAVRGLSQQGGDASNSSTSGPVMHQFMLKLEAHIFENTQPQAGQQSLLRSLKPDCGYATVELCERQAAADREKWSEGTNIDDKTRLNVVGHVTKMPLVGSIKCCSAFGQDFYLYGGDLVIPEEVAEAPAPPAKRARRKAKAVPKPEAKPAMKANCDIDAKSFDFRFKYADPLSGLQTDLSVKVTLHAVAPQSSILKQEQPIKLVRPTIAAMVKPPTQAQEAEANAKAKAKAKALGKVARASKKHTAVPEWQYCSHLFK